MNVLSGPCLKFSCRHIFSSGLLLALEDIQIEKPVIMHLAGNRSEVALEDI